jgi:aldehyde:ferredoxin oxidoreductase
MKINRFLIVISALGILAACAPMSRYEAVKSPAILKAVQDARTYIDHNALAKRFENLAKEMRIKAEEQRRLLEHYQEKSYLYGRQAQDRKSHTWALMHRYEQAAKTSLSKAASHRQMAAKLKQDGYATPIRQTENAANNPKTTENN